MNVTIPGMLFFFLTKTNFFECYFTIVCQKIDSFSSIVASSTISIVGFITTAIAILFSIDSPHLQLYKKEGYFKILLLNYLYITFIGCITYIATLLAYYNTTETFKYLIFLCITSVWSFLLFIAVLVRQMYRCNN